MRVSADETDIGYSPELVGRTKVYLDEVEQQQRCVTADEEQGICIVYVEQENGDFVVEDEELVRETKHGRVRIEIKPLS